MSTGRDLYPDQRKAERLLQAACPDADAVKCNEMAAMVSRRRRTISQAIAELMELGTTEEDKTAAAVEGGDDSNANNHHSKGRSSGPEQRPTPPFSTHALRRKTDADSRSHLGPDSRIANTQEPTSTRRSTGYRGATELPSLTPSSGRAECGTKATPRAATTQPLAPTPSEVFAHGSQNRNRSWDTHTDDPLHRVIHEEDKSSQHNLIHYYYGDDATNYAEEVLTSPGQAILFTTSMTGDRQVRDHCRQLETLLYIKRIPHHVMDVADNAFLKKKARELHRRVTGDPTMPPMPLLCVDDRCIGGYEAVQELEDCQELDHRLSVLGVPDEHLHRAKPNFLDPAKREANYALMTPTSKLPAGTSPRVSGSGVGGAPDVDDDTATAGEGGGAEAVHGAASPTSKSATKGAGKRRMSVAAAAAAEAAVEARRRVQELEAARKARQQASARRAADEAREQQQQQQREAEEVEAAEQAKAERALIAKVEEDKRRRAAEAARRERGERGELQRRGHIEAERRAPATAATGTRGAAPGGPTTSDDAHFSSLLPPAAPVQTSGGRFHPNSARRPSAAHASADGEVGSGGRRGDRLDVDQRVLHSARAAP